MPLRTINPKNIICTFRSCGRTFSTKAGLTNHLRTHRTPLCDPQLQRHPSTPAPPEMTPEPDHIDNFIEHEPPLEQADPGQTQNRPKKIRYHPYLNGLPCDTEGNFLPNRAPPPPWDYPPPDDYSPFANQAAFELADLLFRKDQMSAGNIGQLLQIWAATLPADQDPPFINKRDLLETIDSISALKSGPVRFSGHF
jgi:hypothetical protein